MAIDTNRNRTPGVGTWKGKAVLGTLLSPYKDRRLRNLTPPSSTDRKRMPAPASASPAKLVSALTPPPSGSRPSIDCPKRPLGGPSKSDFSGPGSRDASIGTSSTKEPTPVLLKMPGVTKRRNPARFSICKPRYKGGKGAQYLEDADEELPPVAKRPKLPAPTDGPSKHAQVQTEGNCTSSPQPAARRTLFALTSSSSSFYADSCDGDSDVEVPFTVTFELKSLAYKVRRDGKLHRRIKLEQDFHKMRRLDWLARRQQKMLRRHRKLGLVTEEDVICHRLPLSTTKSDQSTPPPDRRPSRPKLQAWDLSWEESRNETPPSNKTKPATAPRKNATARRSLDEWFSRTPSPIIRPR